ncbi:uracil phosphoribosyltransferase [soil metagenome]
MPTVVTHPLIQSRLTALRDKKTAAWDFRKNVHEISQLLLYEATADLPTMETSVSSPLAETTGAELANTITLVPILRAGLGMLNGMMEILTEAQVGHIGLVRNEQTFISRQYFCKLPSDITTSQILLLDPMLATGGSALKAIQQLTDAGAQHIRFVCILASPQGIALLEESVPDVPLFTASIDDGLDDRNFIVPGLGDAGDRYFGTI